MFLLHLVQLVPRHLQITLILPRTPLPLTRPLLRLYKVLLRGIRGAFVIGSTEFLIACPFLESRIFGLELPVLIACTFELSKLVFVGL